MDKGLYQHKEEKIAMAAVLWVGAVLSILTFLIHP